MLYLVQDFVCGGPLRLLMMGRMLGDRAACFYGANIAIAVSHLHNKGFIFRDVSPDSVWIDDKGYLKLTDFACARPLAAKATCSSFCGTPEYMSPEMVRREEYNGAVDWFALGCIVYEMLIGNTPFAGADEVTTYRNILAGRIEWPWWLYFFGTSRSLMQGLLQPKAEERLGYNAPRDVTGHLFFASIGLETLEARRMVTAARHTESAPPIRALSRMSSSLL